MDTSSGDNVTHHAVPTVAPIFGIFFQSEVNPNFRDQLSIFSAAAPFLGIFYWRNFVVFQTVWAGAQAVELLMLSSLKQ